jgi:Fe-S-cluster containining protein
MKKHFACTVCGKCCYGWLPLTVADATRLAHLFPLAVLWSTVRQGSKAFALAQKLGVSFDKKTALRVTPLAYIPPTLPCPALGDDHRCSIHDTKPQRCRTMPFSADREAADQADLLIPRKDWLCDVSEIAPTVYDGGRILDQSDFNLERQALLDQVPTIRAYVEMLLKRFPTLALEVEKLAKRPAGGQMVLKISPLLRKMSGFDMTIFASRQAMVLRQALLRLPAATDYADYRRNYGDWLAEMESLRTEKEENA